MNNQTQSRPAAPGIFDLFANTETPLEVIQDFEKSIVREAEESSSEDSVAAVYAAFADRISKLGVEMPAFKRGGKELTHSMLRMISAKKGYPIGFDCENLAQLSCATFDQAKYDLVPLGFAVKHYGFHEAMIAKDTEGKWKQRSDIAIRAIQNEDTRYKVRQSLMTLLSYWMPEVKAKCEHLQRNGIPKVQTKSAASMSSSRSVDNFEEANKALNAAYLEEVESRWVAPKPENQPARRPMGR